MPASRLPTTLIDRWNLVCKMLVEFHRISLRPADQPRPSLYIELAGKDLSRNGNLSLMTLYSPELNRIFVVDVEALGTTAFDACIYAGVGVVSLRSVFESPWIVKVFFDVRNQADALYGHYCVRLNNVRDVQAMERGSCLENDQLVDFKSLGKCLKDHARLTEEEYAMWEATNEKRRKLLADQPAIFEHRPLVVHEIVEYCVNDVAILPRLEAVYAERLRANDVMARKAAEETERRMEEAQRPIDMHDLDDQALSTLLRLGTPHPPTPTAIEADE